MVTFIAKRILLWIPTVLIVLLAVYALIFFGAGDPIKVMFLRAPGDVAYDPARIEAIRESAGLNRPFFAQFADYLVNLVQGDWGNSLVNGRPVLRTLAAAAPVSIQLTLASVVVTALIGIPLGVIAALNQDRLADQIIVTVALLFWAVPPYVVGPLMMVTLITALPPGAVPFGWGGFLDVRIILPVAVMVLQPVALIVRQTRAAVIEIMNEDFIRTARAKGLPSHRVIRKHILRPVLTPVVTQLGLIAVVLINGAIFVELIFGLPGLGRLTLHSFTHSDYPVVLGVTLLGTLLVMTTNLVVDAIYPLLDPRANEPRTQ